VVVNPDGSSPVTLVRGQDVSISSWSPDGRWLVYQKQDVHSNDQSWIVSADGTGKPKRLDRQVYEPFSQWSPDGRSILIQTGMGSEALSLWLVDVVGQKPSKKLADGEAGVWSPDSQRLAFICRSSPVYVRSLCVINADGTDLKSLGYATQAVSWSPNGTQLAFVDETKRDAAQLTVIDRNGAQMRRLSPAQWFQFCLGSVCF
jgi:Tol biopolymer transport system component